MNKLRHYKLSIDRRIEPDSIRVFDCYIKEEWICNIEFQKTTTHNIGILSARDQLGFYDII
jgi:hypothetical protein